MKAFIHLTQVYLKQHLAQGYFMAKFSFIIYTLHKKLYHQGFHIDNISIKGVV